MNVQVGKRMAVVRDIVVMCVFVAWNGITRTILLANELWWFIIQFQRTHNCFLIRVVLPTGIMAVVINYYIGSESIYGM